MTDIDNSRSSTRVLRPFSGSDRGSKRRDDFPMVTIEIKVDELAAVIARLQTAGEIANAGALECLAIIEDLRAAALGVTDMLAQLGAEVLAEEAPQ